MIVMYVLQTCPYCNAARQLLAEKGRQWQEIDVGAHPTRRAEMIERSGRSTVPEIWIGERHAGGFEDLAALKATGALDELLRDAGAAAERAT